MSIDIRTIATGSKGNCYLLTNSRGEFLILECGIPWKKIAEAIQWNLSNVVGCCISHEHGDHARAVNDIRNHLIPIYCSEGTAEKLGLKGSMLWRRVGGEWSGCHASHFFISAFPAVHDAAEPLIFVIQEWEADKDGDVVLFATDTEYIPKKVRGITKMMVEANYDMDYINESLVQGSLVSARKIRTVKTHMEIGTLEAWLKEEKAIGGLDLLTEVHLIHVSKQNGYPEEFVRRIQRITGVPVYCEGGRK